MLKPGKILLINSIIFIMAVILVVVAGVFVLHTLAGVNAAEEEEKDTTPPLLYDIEASNVTGTSSVITWQTSELTDSLVNFGLDKSYGVVRDPRYDKTEHTILLDGLLEDTLYHFRITSSDESGNQGISSDYTFTTKRIEVEKKGEGLAEKIIEEGDGGMSVEGVEEILQAIKEITSEEILERIEEEIEDKAKEIVLPPTIILDMAQVEIGTDYVIIYWETDKESNSIVAMAESDDYDEEDIDPYVWKEGEPDELVLEHTVEITGLSSATEYHFRVSSQSALGLTGYSKDRIFKTKSIKPEVFNIRLSKIEEESATIKYSTNVPCSSIVEYTNLNTNETKLEGNSSYLTVHTMKLTNLIFDTYYSAQIKVESEDGEKGESVPLTFITIRDEYAPVISKVNTESTLYPGTENKVQTIVSWYTDEGAQCQLFYHQGLIVLDEPDALLKEEDYGTKHVQVVTNFLPSTVYKFWIVCNDEAQNEGESEDFTMLTPTQEESIIDIIIKNFESSFGWLKRK